MNRTINGKEILITGGTGSLGKSLVKAIIKDGHKPRGIRIYSRDEQKQWAMSEEIAAYQKQHGTSIPVAYLIGDVRDRNRTVYACKNVDLVFNAAAMKHVPACEDNPLEAIRTNVHGAENVLESALANNVEAVMHVSTDKAVHPINLYGATKLAAEKLFINGNVYAGRARTRFACCRYGNVLGSNGSVLVRWRQRLAEGRSIQVTDKNMTRFWITLPRVARFLLDRVCDMNGGEVFIPCMGSLSMGEMVEYVAGPFFSGTVEEIGARPGEKYHEVLIAPEEPVIKVPANTDSHMWWYFKVGQGVSGCALYSNGREHPNWWITKEEFQSMLEDKL